MFSSILRIFRKGFSTKFNNKNGGEVIKLTENLPEKAAFNPNPEILPTSSVPQNVFKDRIALIFRPSRTVMQSGRAQTHKWLIQFNCDVQRWENPLMGWSSSRDPIQGTNLKFENKEEAIKYAKDQGWAYEVKESEEIPLRPKSYAENFLYSSKKLKMIKTK
jgi:NADH dehydrogenase (ubiquinone) Fe-S protein 4